MFAYPRSTRSISSKAVRRRAEGKPPKQSEGFRALGFAETISCRKIIFHHRGRRDHGVDRIYRIHSETLCSFCPEIPFPGFLLSLLNVRTLSWHLRRFAKGELELKRERPVGVVRDGIGFYETLRRFRIDSEEWRVRKIAEVIDDDFLLFRVPEVQAAHVDAVDCSGSRTSYCRARGGRRRRSGWAFRRAFLRDA